MKQRVLIAVAGFVVVAAFTSDARAGFVPSSELRSDCAPILEKRDQHTNADITKINRCVRYVAGVVDMYERTVASGCLSRKSSACIPESATPESIADVFVRFANENPKMLDSDASALLVDAVTSAWPCAETMR